MIVGEGIGDSLESATAGVNIVPFGDDILIDTGGFYDSHGLDREVMNMATLNYAL